MRSSFLKRKPLALLLACLLTACGGGGSSGSGAGTGVTPAPTPTPTPVPPVDSSIAITSAAGSVENRLACNKGAVVAECGLRIYQVMVESFVDGNPSADYNAGYGTSQHKGDLQGIINSLDYIKSTGSNALWLTPVFESTPKAGQDIWTTRLDATGYFTSNYFNIDPKFGTLAQAKTLVAEAHKRGIYVFFDGVFGHHKDNLAPSPTGKLPVTTSTCLSDSGTYKAGSNQQCDDYSSTATVDFYKEVVRYWITQVGIDGWRLDQAYQIPTSAWQTLRAEVKSASQAVTYTNAAGTSVNPLGYMVAEVWSGESTIQSKAYGPTSSPALASAFDFPARYRVVQTLAVEESGYGKQPATKLKEVFSTHSVYADHAMPNLMLTNHDLVRFGDLLQRGGIAEPTNDAYWARHKLAFSFMAAYSGPVTLYYGDEIGQEVANFSTQQSSNTCAAAGLCDDHVSRSPALVEGVATSFGGAVGVLNARQADLKAYVAKLWALRDANPALAYGSRTHVYADSTLYVDRKDAGSNRVLLIMNTGTSAASIKLDTAAIGADTGLTDLVAGDSIAAASGSYAITVPALSARFLKF
ncbi:alpha-amylase family glycosyl hydrolase [Niveibacterium umoris]|uniref:Glycosidase n=1 Tax=Niveibacterium umoris TaxID=1193620 RepID=A0A840BFM7_9RHOO|nr:alpha-amylase family protein [Niveibacterium umoris]MBB4011830.1 glycosidase [Niveibacterium umoris]